MFIKKNAKRLIQQINPHKYTYIQNTYIYIAV